MFDIISSCAAKPPESRGAFLLELEDLATRQLDEFVISENYRSIEPENPGLRPKEIHGRSFNDAALILWSRIDNIRQKMGSLDENAWISKFVDSCESKRKELESTWKVNWKIEASGKIIIDDLYARYEINKTKSDFKKLIIAQMAAQRTETWRVLNSVLDDNLNR